MSEKFPHVQTCAAMTEARAMARNRRSNTMPLTQDFKETVAVRVQKDLAFAQALREEAITLFVNGEYSTPNWTAIPRGSGQ